MALDDLKEILSRISEMGPSWTVNQPSTSWWIAILSGYDFSMTGTTIQGFKIHLSRGRIPFKEEGGGACSEVSIRVEGAQGGVVFHDKFGEKLNPSECKVLQQWMTAEFRPLYDAEHAAQSLKNQAAKREFFTRTDSPER